jgi:hypothetical protein
VSVRFFDPGGRISPAGKSGADRQIHSGSPDEKRRIPKGSRVKYENQKEEMG